MKELIWFIKIFVKKNRQERLLNFLTYKNKKLWDELMNFQKNLNETKYCMYSERVHEEFDEITKLHSINEAVFVSFDISEDALNIEKLAIDNIKEKLNNDSDYIICSEKKQLGFYKNHHGNLWVCKD